METERKVSAKQYTVQLSRLAICAYTCLAFLLHLFTYELSATVYCLTLIGLVFVFAVAKPVVLHSMPPVYLYAWLASLIVLLTNYLFRYKSNAVLIDVSVLLSGFVVISCISQKSDDYTAALSVIRKMTIFFAVGVMIQSLIPSVYSVIIQLFPPHIRNSLRSGLSGVGKIKGFTTNPGFTAGYIVAGIFAVYAFGLRDYNIRKRNLVTILLLFVALLMTRKRGPLLFMVLTIAIVQILPERGTKRFKKLWFGLMSVLAIIVFFLLFQDILAQIPLLSRMVVSIQGFLSGEDVTNGRSRLTIWALQLFRRNPVYGIGWGRYRTTTIGNATLTKSLDTHNVFLQLLCETGIIGFAAFTLVFVLSWNMTRKGYCDCIRTEDPNLKKWAQPLFFSFAFQTYFLLYCLTGNPLYDQFYQILYALSCSIAVAYNYFFKRNWRRETYSTNLPRR